VYLVWVWISRGCSASTSTKLNGKFIVSLYYPLQDKFKEKIKKKLFRRIKKLEELQGQGRKMIWAQTILKFNNNKLSRRGPDLFSAFF
jgi:hypothetical protein